MNPANRYKQELSKFLEISPDGIKLYWKGRVALYALLKAIGVERDDEVIIPAFTCVVVPNAVLYLHAKPVYVDIDPVTYNPDQKSIERAITDKTKVIICQNTFGLSTNVDEVVRMAKSKGIKTIEDCTHGFGGNYQGRPNGSYCDAAFYSTQWNKPFSTGIGGFAAVNNPDILEKLEKVNLQLVEPNFREQMSLKAQLFARQHLLTSGNYWRMLRLYRMLSNYNLVIGSSSGGEVSGTAMPSRYFLNQSSVQIEAGLDNIKNLNDLLRLRKRNAEMYSEYLLGNEKTHVPEQLFDNHSFLKYPLIVGNRRDFEQHAEAEQIALGDWFNSPLHPVESDLNPWGMNRNHFPNADSIAAKIVNLPTDIDNPEMVIAFLKKHLDLIE